MINAIIHVIYRLFLSDLYDFAAYFINPETASGPISSINGVTTVLFNVYIRNVREPVKPVCKSVHDLIPSLKQERREGEKLQQCSPQPSHRLSLAQPITHIANLLDGGQISRTCLRTCREKKIKRIKRKLMHGYTRGNPDVNREEGTEKREREKMGVDDKGGARCDEVCRNILQPKPINKRRLGRRIKTHTSRYWLRVAAFPHLLALAKLVLHHLYLPSVSHSPCISRRKPSYVPTLR